MGNPLCARDKVQGPHECRDADGKDIPWPGPGQLPVVDLEGGQEPSSGLPMYERGDEMNKPNIYPRQE